MKNPLWLLVVGILVIFFAALSICMFDIHFDITKLNTVFITWNFWGLLLVVIAYCIYKISKDFHTQEIKFSDKANKDQYLDLLEGNSELQAMIVRSHIRAKENREKLEIMGKELFPKEEK